MPARIERKTREALAKRAHFSAILPLSEAYEPDLNGLVHKVQRIVAPSGAKVLLHPEMRKLEKAETGGLLGFGAKPTETRMIFLVIDHVGVWIAARQGPLEHYGALGRWANPEVWPEGLTSLSNHAAWVEICDLGFMRDRGVERLDRAFNRAAAVTAAMAAVAASSKGVGLLWHPARNALPIESFVDQVEQVILGRAPLDLWMRWFYVQPEDPALKAGVITRGLLPFVGHEVEVRPSQLAPEEAVELTYEFARMLIDRGTEPRTGMIVAPGRNLRATVRVGESSTRDRKSVV